MKEFMTNTNDPEKTEKEKLDEKIKKELEMQFNESDGNEIAESELDDFEE